MLPQESTAGERITSLVTYLLQHSKRLRTTWRCVPERVHRHPLPWGLPCFHKTPAHVGESFCNMAGQLCTTSQSVEIASAGTCMCRARAHPRRFGISLSICISRGMPGRMRLAVNGYKESRVRERFVSHAMRAARSSASFKFSCGHFFACDTENLLSTLVVTHDGGFDI